MPVARIAQSLHAAIDAGDYEGILLVRIRQRGPLTRLYCPCCGNRSPVEHLAGMGTISVRCNNPRCPAFVAAGREPEARGRMMFEVGEEKPRER